MTSRSRIVIWNICSLYMLCVSEFVNAFRASISAEIRNNATAGFKIRLTGTYISPGIPGKADGFIVRLHPMGLCNRRHRQKLLKVSWIAVIFLQPDIETGSACDSLQFKAMSAAERGSAAVIFVRAAAQVGLRPRLSGKVDIPVVLIDETSGNEMNNFLEMSVAQTVFPVVYGHIRPVKDTPSMLHKDRGVSASGVVSVFLIFFVFSCICVTIMVKIHMHNRKRDESEIQSLIRAAVEKLQTDIYVQPTVEYDTSRDQCSVCLETFVTGEELRILPCQHHFHVPCIDPWLMTHGTCPLCLTDILGDSLRQRLSTPVAARRSDNWRPVAYSSVAQHPSSPLALRPHAVSQNLGSNSSLHECLSSCAAESGHPPLTVSPLTREDSRYSIKFNLHINEFGLWYRANSYDSVPASVYASEREKTSEDDGEEDVGGSLTTITATSSRESLLLPFAYLLTADNK